MNWLRDLFSRQPSYPAGDSTPDAAADLIEAETMAAELVDYLFGNRLFRQISVQTPLGDRQPKMTLGGLYERIKHLEAAVGLGAGDRRRLQAVVEAWEAARRRYPDQVREKLQRELESYLKNWKFFLDQYARDPDRWKEEYDVELRNRRRVELVLRLLGSDAPAGVMEDLAQIEPKLDES